MPRPKNKDEYRAELAETFAHILEEQGLNWKKEWHGQGINAPYNAVTKAHYRGINAFWLSLVSMAQGYTDPRWVTMVQIMDNDGKYHPKESWHLKKGSKAAYVEYWYPYDLKEKKAITWKQYQDALKNGRTEAEFKLSSRYYAVFNAQNVEGMPPLEVKQVQSVPIDQLVQTLSQNMGVPVFTDGGDRAYYSPGKDEIHLPKPESFFSEYAFNSTALHELAHSTGHASRLNRDLSGGFGSQAYAYEELVAEMCSAFMSADLAAEATQEHIENHKAYVQSWIKAIREKPETLVKAIKDAQEAAVYMDSQAELIPEEENRKVMESAMEISEDKIRTPGEEANSLELSSAKEAATKNEPIFDFEGDGFSIYQVGFPDEQRVRFMGMDWLERHDIPVDRQNYDLVYTAPLDEDSDLEDLYRRFNTEIPEDFRGAPMSVSDVVVIKRAGEITCHFCDTIGFQEVPGFLPGTEAERQRPEPEQNRLTVLVVEPGKIPYTKQIPDTLQSLQNEVGGYIQAVYPFRDPVCVICNEEAKLEGLTVNGNLFLLRTKISQLPEGLTVGNSLDLRNTPITQLPEGLTVNGDLNLRNTPITNLPEGLAVVGNLNLRNTPITQLPEKLTVGYDLDLRNTQIIRLPKDLTVRGYVYLNEKQIAQLPKGLTVDGTLDPERLSILNSVSNICGPSAESEALEWDE